MQVQQIKRISARLAPDTGLVVTITDGKRAKFDLTEHYTGSRERWSAIDTIRSLRELADTIECEAMAMEDADADTPDSET